LIYAGRSEEVFVSIGRLLDGLAGDGDYRALFDLALSHVRERAEAGAIFMPIDIPLVVAEVLERPPEEDVVAAAACTLLWMGADLMDDAADGDLVEAWSGVSKTRLALVSTNLLATLPHLVTQLLHSSSRSDAATSRFSQLVALTLWQMSEGQFADLGSVDAVRTVEDYSQMIRLKSGAEVAFFASAPAVLAGLCEPDAEAWGRFGSLFGCMAQLYSDVHGAFSESSRNDLYGGKRTLPVIYTLENLPDSAAARFSEDLAGAASGDAEALGRAIRHMNDAGAARFCLSRVELLRHRAVSSLPPVLAELSVDHPLRTVLRQFSVI
jgi:geranylgeranyl pyrophosphate synthase